MTSKGTDVKNVHEDAEQAQKLEAKVAGLIAFMKEEQQAQIVPILSVSERGIIPDARVVLVPDNVEENGDTSETAEDGSEGDAGEGSDETTATESTES